MTAQLRFGCRSDAHVSGCGRYRYWLTRDWGDDRQRVTFIGLNPSTADATEDDPTIRWCVRFAQDWGYGGLVMLNLYAYRATDPRELMEASDPVGPRNDETIRAFAVSCVLLVAAWGATSTLLSDGRASRVLALLDGYFLWVLGVTKDGHPRHPLYLRADAKPELWNPLAPVGHRRGL